METTIFKGPVLQAPDFFVEHYDQLGSTNTLAMERARAGHEGKLWVRTNEQTQGRGRRGRVWTSSRGNMFASLLLKLPQDADKLMQLPFVAALALAEAVEEVCGHMGFVHLKWPNDLLVDRAKISGILLESVPAGDGCAYVVVGLGVNVAHHPQIEDYKTNSLQALGFRVDADQVFAALAQRMALWLERWQAAQGFSEVRREWLKRAVGRGEEVRVRLVSEEFTGIFRDIDDMGRLVVKRDDGREQLVSAGDVFFR